VLTWAVIAAFGLPILWMVLTSLKPADQVMDPGAILPRPPWSVPRHMLDNYGAVLHDRVVDFPLYLRNTLLVALLNVSGAVLSSAVVAYGFARVRWRPLRPLFLVVLATMMIPAAVLVVPLYAIFRELGWIGSFKPLWVPAWFGSAFGIFLLRQFMLTIPRELDDAARLDGCGHPRIFMHILLPLSLPALAAVALLQFMFVWNDFLTPLVFLTHRDQYTAALGLHLYQSQQGSTPFNLLMAASTLFVAPPILVFVLWGRALAGTLAGPGNS
jgi:multiple sugar transport system permease protein